MGILDKVSKETATSLVSVMKKIDREVLESVRPEFYANLSPSEKFMQRYVDKLAFQEGAWYRPSHNLVVPSAMKIIIRGEGLNPDLVYPAQIHDAGNTMLVIKDTTQGAAWESKDKRVDHMRIGSAMAHTILNCMHLEGKINMEDGRINAICEIIGQHDDPYIGKAFNPVSATLIEHQGHRDADRVFVPTALSFYKDLIAHYSDPSYVSKADNLGIEISPRNLLAARLAFFYGDERECISGIDFKNFPLDTRLAEYNEGGKVERPNTRTGSKIIGDVLNERANELATVENLETVEAFGEFFRDVHKKELEKVIRLGAAA